MPSTRRGAQSGARPRWRAMVTTLGGRTWVMVSAFILLSVLLYAPTLRNALVYDDHEVITRNDSAHGIENTLRIFTTASWWSSRVAYVRHYRPLTTWTYALNYSLHGLHPAGYHLVNTVVHGATSALVVGVVQATGLSSATAVLAALLFLAHPIHSEAVAWVNCRADLLSAMGILMAVMFHTRARTTSGRRRQCMKGGIVVACAVAALSKETGFMAPLVIVAWDFVLYDRLRIHASWVRIREEGWAEYAMLAVVFAACLVGRRVLVGWRRRSYRVQDGVALGRGTRGPAATHRSVCGGMVPVAHDLALGPLGGSITE